MAVTRGRGCRNEARSNEFTIGCGGGGGCVCRRDIWLNEFTLGVSI